jgi:hypothetical protein
VAAAVYRFTNGMNTRALKVKIAQVFSDHLEEYLDDIAGVIKGGPLQDNPVRQRVSITLRDMDPLKADSDWIDRPMSAIPTDQRRFSMATAEIGGNQAWALRGVCEVNVNFAAERNDREDAYQESEWVKEKLSIYLSTAPVSGLVSDNRAWQAIWHALTKIDTKEQGGKGKWIWRYFVYYEVYAYFDPYAAV